jgi:hypothetical protein
MENSTPFTHRVARAFVSGDFVHSVGDLVSDADWTHQGKEYVESLGWVVPLTKDEIAAAVATEIVEEAPAVLEEVVEEAAPITTPKFVVAPAKKAAKKPVKRAAKP